MAVVIKDGIQHRRGTAEALRRNNPLPKRGEIITEVDTGQAKCGDGVKHWNALPYIGADPEGVRALVQQYLEDMAGGTDIDGGEITLSD